MWRFFHKALAIWAFGVLAVAPTHAASGRHAAMIVDGNTGSVLLNEDGDAPRHPASLTKMMTLYLTFETVESGRLKMSDRIAISEAAADVAPSKLDLDPGEDLSVGEAIKALITKSANDVAVALAERIGGSQANFVRLMNTRARDLGMAGTHFENASGLPNPDQITTARDMSTLALALQDHFPGYYGLFATREFNFRGKTFRNHNTMLKNFAGIDGIKTGYTQASGFNLVSSVRRGGRHLIGVVFGGESAATRNGEMRVILTRALTRASNVKTRKPSSSLLAKLKSEPKIAARPARKDKEAPASQVAAVSAAPPVARPFAAAGEVRAEAPPPGEQPAAVAAEGHADPTSTPIEVFKVKRVAVRPNPVARADETTDMPDETGGGGIAAALARADRLPVKSSYEVASAEPTAPPSSIAEALARHEATGQPGEARDAKATNVPKTAANAAISGRMDLIGAVARPSSPAPAPAPVSEPAVAPPPPREVQRGLPPSTLQAQAHSLGFASQTFQQSAQARTARTDGAQVGSTDGGRYAIQIGAYGSIDEAQQALSAAQAKAGRVLKGHASVTHPFQKNGQQFYRARFTGFEQARASDACSALKRQSVDCFVMSAE